MTPPNSDLGVILFASGNGAGAFTARDGQPGTVRTLTAANWIASAWLDAGRLADAFITVSGVISAQLASVEIIVERRRRDSYNVALFNPAVISTTRLDQPAAPPAALQTIVRADLVGQNVSAWPAVAPAPETLDVVFRTTDQRWAGECRVLIKASNAPEATDRIIVAINGGG